MSAADVLAVATPSWKMKGLRSANDLAFVVVVDVDGDVAAGSDFVSASFVVELFVLRRLMAMGDRQIKRGDRDDGVISRRDSSMLLVAIIVSRSALDLLSFSTTNQMQTVKVKDTLSGEVT
jgi:hypothetical protein